MRIISLIFSLPQFADQTYDLAHRTEGDREIVDLISEEVTSTSTFMVSFDLLLKHLLQSLDGQAVGNRTRALRGLGNINAVDIDLLDQVRIELSDYLNTIHRADVALSITERGEVSNRDAAGRQQCRRPRSCRWFAGQVRLAQTGAFGCLLRAAGRTTPRCGLGRAQAGSAPAQNFLLCFQLGESSGGRKYAHRPLCQR